MTYQSPFSKKDATNLANVASKLSKSELKQLMSISDKLADLIFKDSKVKK